MNNHFSAKSVVNAATLQQLTEMVIGGEYPATLTERYPEMTGPRIR